MFWLPFVSAKKIPEADASCRVDRRRIEALGTRDRAAEVGDILERRLGIRGARRRRLNDT